MLLSLSCQISLSGSNSALSNFRGLRKTRFWWELWWRFNVRTQKKSVRRDKDSLIWRIDSFFPLLLYWIFGLLGSQESCYYFWGQYREKEGNVLRQYKIIVEKHSDGYVAYPLGLKGVVVGEGDTYEEALADVKSAIRFHIETFGEDVLEEEKN